MTDSKVAKSNPRGLFTALAVIAWFCLSVSIYLIFFQLPGGIVSNKYLLLSMGIGALVTLPFIVAIYKKIDLQTVFSRKSLSKIFFQSLFLFLVVLILLPLPRNSFLAPVVKMDLTFVGEPNSSVDIRWINNGLGDISFSSVQVSGKSEIRPESLHIPLDELGKAQLSWQGRAWREARLVMNSSQPVKIISAINGSIQTFPAEEQSGSERVLVLPVGSSQHYSFAGLVLLPVLFISVFFLVALVHLMKQSAKNPQPSMGKSPERFPANKVFTWVYIVIGVIYSFLAIFLVIPGLFNRLYFDDFCYLNIIHRYGFFGAIIHNYLSVNGRFASHTLNYLAFSLGRSSIPLGSLVVLLFVGGSLVFLFSGLIIRSQEQETKWVAKPFLAAIIFSLIVMVTVSLMAPFLYESVFWTLHALIVAGGLFMANLLAGLVLRFSDAARKKIGQAAQGIIFAVIGFFAMGFSEPTSIFLLSVYIMFIILLLIKKTLRKFTGIVTGFAVGAIAGLMMVVFSPATSNRAGTLGISLNPAEILSQYFTLIQSSFSAILFDRSSNGLIVLAVALILGYTMGRNLRIRIRFEDHLTSTPSGEFLLLILPIFTTISTMLPFAFLKGYLPERTLYIPIYFLVIQYFLISLYFGRKDTEKDLGKKIWFTAALLGTLVVGIIGLNYVGGLVREIRIFSTEFDTHEAAIARARALGLESVNIGRFSNPARMNIPDDPANWYTTCLREYYGIEVTSEK